MTRLSAVTKPRIVGATETEAIALSLAAVVTPTEREAVALAVIIRAAEAEAAARSLAVALAATGPKAITLAIIIRAAERNAVTLAIIIRAAERNAVTPAIIITSAAGGIAVGGPADIIGAAHSGTVSAALRSPSLAGIVAGSMTDGRRKIPAACVSPGRRIAHAACSLDRHRRPLGLKASGDRPLGCTRVVTKSRSG
ncbi:MAG: hypothetical protein WBP94_00710 [Rhodomicrobiaceae bacterium]